MKIVKIEIGFVNDDFLHQRYSALAEREDKSVYVLRIYKDRIVVIDTYSSAEKACDMMLKKQLYECDKVFIMGQKSFYPSLSSAMLTLFR